MMMEIHQIFIFAIMAAILYCLYLLEALDGEIGARENPHGVSLYFTVPPSSEKSSLLLLFMFCLGFASIYIFRNLATNSLKIKCAWSLKRATMAILVLCAILQFGHILFTESFGGCRIQSEMRFSPGEIRRQKQYQRILFGLFGCDVRHADLSSLDNYTREVQTLQHMPAANFRLGDQIITRPLPSSAIQTEPPPIPYSAFSMLCLDPAAPAFVALGDAAAIADCLADDPPRGYSAVQQPVRPRAESDRLLPGTTLLLAEQPDTAGYLLHLFHVLEHLVPLWALGAEALRADVRLVALLAPAHPGLARRPARKDGPGGATAFLVAAMFPAAALVTFEELLQLAGGGGGGGEGGLACMERALVSDRLLGARRCGK
jgi:hypothetical protein